MLVEEWTADGVKKAGRRWLGRVKREVVWMEGEVKREEVWRAKREEGRRGYGVRLSDFYMKKM